MKRNDKMQNGNTKLAAGAGGVKRAAGRSGRRGTPLEGCSCRASLALAIGAFTSLGGCCSLLARFDGLASPSTASHGQQRGHLRGGRGDLALQGSC